jgi:TRIAD3 protein (E3 ubiquitin-protein ligase RNF216)
MCHRRGILREEFPETPMNYIDATLSQLGYRLFSAYQILQEAQQNYDPTNPPYNKVKRRNTNEFGEDQVSMLLETTGIPPDRGEILAELVAARRIRVMAEQEREAARRIELEEELNTRRAVAEGSMKECGCCCGDFPLNRMVHCDGDEAHWFCRKCALTNAETQVGASRYELECMSMEGCAAGFSREQR